MRSLKVLWDRDDYYGLIVVLEDDFIEIVQALDVLVAAETVGEIRAATDGNAWLAEHFPWTIIEVLEEGLANQEVTDETPYCFHSHAYHWHEIVPFPYIAEVVDEWLGEEFVRKHVDVFGGSPAGHIDAAHFRGPKAKLQALELIGYELEERPGLLQEYLLRL